MPSIAYLSVPPAPIAFLILVGVFGLFAATYVTRNRARYRQRLEDAYRRFDQSARDGARATVGDQYSMPREPGHARPIPTEQLSAIL